MSDKITGVTKTHVFNDSDCQFVLGGFAHALLSFCLLPFLFCLIPIYAVSFLIVLYCPLCKERKDGN